MNRQVSVTQEEALRRKFSGHRSVLSPDGILKVLATVFFIIGSILSLSFEVCSRHNSWLQVVFPLVTAIGAVLLVCLYGGAILGLAKKNPNTWAKLDISCCLIVAVSNLIFSILLLSICTNPGIVTKIPGILGGIGAILVMIAAATLYVSWSNIEAITAPVPAIEMVAKRQSVFI